jgi:flagellar hook-basal body complex protein FliE
MIGKIGGGDSALVREAMQAARRYLPDLASEGAATAGTRDAGQGLRPVNDAKGPNFLEALEDGLQSVDAKVRGADDVPQDLLTGKIDDFHEIAVQLKDAELSFRFAMEIRNKLIDAYREIMRMNV